MAQGLIGRLLGGLGLRKFDVRGAEVESFASKYGLLYVPDPLGGVRMHGFGLGGGVLATPRMKNELTGRWRDLRVMETDLRITTDSLMPHPATRHTPSHMTHQAKSTYCSFLQADLAAVLPGLHIRSNVTLTGIPAKRTLLPFHTVSVSDPQSSTACSR